MKWLYVIFLCLFPILAQADTLVTYPAPKGAPLNDEFSVEVRLSDGSWKNVPTYAWKVDRVVSTGHHPETTSVANFDFSGKVEVKVTYRKGAIQTFRIRPLSYAIQGYRKDTVIMFTLDRPRHLSIEVNGDIFHNLQLFANAPCPQVRKSRNVIYSGPGYYDLEGDSILVKSGQTLYIDGGAYIKGWASVWHANHAKVIGHGIINPDCQHEGIMVRYSKNVLVDGPLTTQIPVGESDSVTVRNAKCMSWYGWGDGMNVFASNHVHYDHVFCRTSDDCSTIYCTRKGYHGGCKDISVHDAVYWADVAHPIMIGLHGDIERNETIENVRYQDVDILDQAEAQIDYQGCIAINDGDNIKVKDALFENIRIESLRKGMLFNLRVCYNKKYCHAPGRGIEDVIFRRIAYHGKEPNMSIITGYDGQRLVKNVIFDGLMINGTHISDDMQGKPKWYKTADMANIFVGEHVEGLSFQ